MTDYRLIAKQVESLGREAGDYVPFLANVSAVLYDALDDLNWAGFYLMDQGELLLGPFQGKVACIHIPVGSGVCGTAVEKACTQRVEDVHAFPGHIACDAASASEIVVPLHSGGKVIGVLDVDSPLKGRFTEEDQAGLEQVVAVIEECADFRRLTP